MNKSVLKVAIGIAAGLSFAAVPGYSSTALTFTGGTGTTNGITTSGTSINALSGVNYSEMFVSSAPTSADNGEWDISTALSYNTTSHLLSLIGTVTGCHTGSTCTSGNLGNINTSVTLESIQLSGALTLNGTPGYTVSGSGTTAQINVGFGTPTSIADLSTLLTDLGDTGATLTTLSSGGIASGANGTYNTGSGAGSFTPDSNTLALSVTATPEPASMALFGSGLLGLGWLARRRTARK